MKTIKTYNKHLILLLILILISSVSFCQKYKVRLCIKDCQYYGKSMFRDNHDTVFVTDATKKIFWIKGNEFDSVGIKIIERKGFLDSFFNNDKIPKKHNLMYLEFYTIIDNKVYKFNTSSSMTTDELTSKQSCTDVNNTSTLGKDKITIINYSICLKRK